MGFGRTVNVVTEYLPGSMLLGVAAPLVRLSIPISMRDSAGRSLAWGNAEQFPSNG